MRAATYDRFSSDISDVRVRELPKPKVFPGSALVEVRAAGVNPVDWKLMTGGLDGLMDAIFPVIPGWDVAGVVVETGMDTPEFAVGDEVLGYARKDTLNAGTFAELVAVPAATLARKPAELSWEQAGALPLAGGTALRTLDILRVGAGDTVLIHAAAGGVGSLGVQIAKARGARVIGTASERNHDFLRELGAEPVPYGDGLADRVRGLAPEGVDAVADFVGGQLDVTTRVLAANGRHASIADAAVEEHGGHVVWVRPDGAQTQRLADLAAAGSLTVPIARTYPLDEVPQAFAASQDGHVRGKIVIVP
ncbi:NADP-dependent oxidoreductase [Nocardia cyriacigeorgica]|uniref:NADP-dependent oxidoreductase n=1 Tax=Nocardia cyriacigeorgica TaxID=135487 RepID=A0A6P1DBN3_9NOCA|nr:NADP-dependent oxidoreductase [Nocardia cyriacigeorgica]NEW42390.1 NADP-dependent oxidoreductase [Nocardia cyriacigeorgica]NEW46999.1 NADP-dependent oxidoreductase [Nocardia cyriacigeorgica]NEW53912.1 NADP-dependent oxidoreductase [Nocardia cyriacigeorgica]NEW58134.1 NADP-dependent oxidoreductase [Nocardia cyriacigeorgica]